MDIDTPVLEQMAPHLSCLSVWRKHKDLYSTMFGEPPQPPDTIAPDTRVHVTLQCGYKYPDSPLWEIPDAPIAVDQEGVFLGYILHLRAAMHPFANMRLVQPPELFAVVNVNGTYILTTEDGMKVSEL